MGTVVITGAATDYCVDATARSALSHEFDVIVVEDGHSPANRDATGLAPEQVVAHHNWVLRQAIHPGGSVRVIPAADVWFIDS